MITQGKWIFREVGSRSAGGVSQSTTIAISTEDEKHFYGKSIASITVRWPNDDFTNRDGTPDEFEISLNKGKYSLEECLSNAALIAAAPDLLEACKDIVHYIDMCIDAGWEEMNMDALNGAKQAIAKAEGK
jgi:hypothetical protein